MKIKVSANQFITENKKSLSIKDGSKYCQINTMILFMCLNCDWHTNYHWTFFFKVKYQGINFIYAFYSVLEYWLNFSGRKCVETLMVQKYKSLTCYTSKFSCAS